MIYTDQRVLASVCLSVCWAIHVCLRGFVRIQLSICCQVFQLQVYMRTSGLSDCKTVCITAISFYVATSNTQELQFLLGLSTGLVTFPA